MGMIFPLIGIGLLWMGINVTWLITDCDYFGHKNFVHRLSMTFKTTVIFLFTYYLQIISKPVS